ncbi:hypothetical protein [Dermabacter sp. HSID17554]|uniref:hypothetical protein n=1 Tax=Dermabacter sp. HSID17554 TaxID=2419511 RepID=UPI000F87E522|nr:hypothetical protein [Dermabacter sp. HSID17554]
MKYTSGLPYVAPEDKIADYPNVSYSLATAIARLFVRDNDSRLTDKRDPKAHKHPIGDILGLEAKITDLENKLAKAETAATNPSPGEGSTGAAAQYDSGWQSDSSPFTQGTLRYRRIGNTVFMFLDNTKWKSISTSAFPKVGYRPSPEGGDPLFSLAGSSGGYLTVFQTYLMVKNHSATVSAVNLYASWITDDPIPA